MTRHWLWLVAALALLMAGGCSDDEENSPPSVVITFPANGHVFDDADTTVELLVEDDGNVSVVELLLDQEVVTTVRNTKGTLTLELPLGEWADGLQHRLDARAYDVLGELGQADPITVTIDPALQTVPQIVAMAPRADQADLLRIDWLVFPGATDYDYEVSRTDGFSELLASGTTAELGVDLADLNPTLAYARVRASAGATTDWSRTFRYDGTTGWREVYELPDRQMGTAILTAADGSLRLLSHAVREARIATAPVQLLAVAATGEFQAAHDLLDATHWPTSHLLLPDGTLLLAGLRTDGTGFLAGFTLDGAPVFETAPGDLDPTALWLDAGGEVRLAGADHREGALGGVIKTVDPATGALADLITFELESGREVLVGWPRPDAGWVVAGQQPDDEDGNYTGLYARGLSATGATDWNLRVGSADRWLMRGHGTDGDGQYLLGGIAYRATASRRYGFLVNFDHRGRLRWQIGETRWHLYSDIKPTLDGRWTAVGARRRNINDETWLYDTALRGFSDAGFPLFEIQHQRGEESQGWALAPHPDGGWYVAGFTTADRVEYQCDLMRVDDRGELE